MKRTTWGMASLLMAGLLVASAAQDAKQALKAKLKDDQAAGDWIYDDIDAGFARAMKSGLPMLVVFR